MAWDDRTVPPDHVQRHEDLGGRGIGYLHPDRNTVLVQWMTADVAGHPYRSGGPP
jgi:hypothetical protein